VTERPYILLSIASVDGYIDVNTEERLLSNDEDFDRLRPSTVWSRPNPIGAIPAAATTGPVDQKPGTPATEEPADYGNRRLR
jgi:hypothetical protein